MLDMQNAVAILKCSSFQVAIVWFIFPLIFYVLEQPRVTLQIQRWK
jgi:hypothetical protein